MPIPTCGERVVFIGDSITDAFRKPAEQSDAYQLGAGYAFLIAAQMRAQNPDASWEFWNRGISGQGVREVAGRWDEDVLSHSPTLVSVLVGVNEVLRAQNGHLALGPDEFEAELRGLLERTLRSFPTVRFVLCQPFLLPVAGICPGALAAVKYLAARVSALSREFNTKLVPLEQVFEAAQGRAPADFWAFDGIHPTAAGQFLIAQNWIEIVTGARLES